MTSVTEVDLHLHIDKIVSVSVCAQSNLCPFTLTVLPAQKGFCEGALCKGPKSSFGHGGGMGNERDTTPKVCCRGNTFGKITPKLHSAQRPTNSGLLP